MSSVNKLLIANRGEIAVRIIRTAKRMGIRTVGVFSEIDADSLHVKLADEAHCLGESQLSDTYLNIEKIVSIARETSCDAIHPGYGFLAENPLFVKACHDAGILFVGPDETAMHVMGNKIEARRFVEQSGIPVTKGLTGEPSDLVKRAASIGFPVLVKAAAGGGGKGMRIVRTEKELGEALDATSREAKNYFADGTVYLEKYLDNPRHIEFQILADNHGNVVHLFERECTIQRRYQKIIEEAPSPTLTPELRSRMGDAAVTIGKAIGYSSAGTIEFLVDENLDFYFLEMNTRIQVEHPVTEMTTGVDIVEEQLRIAAGEKLRFVQGDLAQTGNAIECRIYAEDPENNFLPSPGQMDLYHEPSGEHIRVDSGITGLPEIKSHFDPMVSKLIVWGADREAARIRMTSALQGYIIHGIRNNIGYLLSILEHDAFISNKISTKYCDEHASGLFSILKQQRTRTNPVVPLIAGLVASLQKSHRGDGSIWESIGYWRQYMHPQLQFEDRFYELTVLVLEPKTLKVLIDGQEYHVGYHLFSGGKMELSVNEKHYLTWVSSPESGKFYISLSGITFEVYRLDLLPAQPEFSNSEMTSGNDMGNIVSPMPGRVIKVLIREGQQVTKGDLLLVVEAMKMENNILSPGDGIVDSIRVETGDLVDGNTPLVHLKSEGKL